jgi:hypothetical protein
MVREGKGGQGMKKRDRRQRGEFGEGEGGGGSDEGGQEKAWGRDEEELLIYSRKNGTQR